MRFDLALFALRLFPSRARATAAIQSGAARLNGERVKPSRELRAGDRVTLEPGRTIEVLALPGRSLSREAAKALLREVDAPPRA